MAEVLCVTSFPLDTFRIPTRCVGMQYRRAAPREAVESNWVLLWLCVTGRSASLMRSHVACGNEDLYKQRPNNG
jgi:hypothetical protein